MRMRRVERAGAVRKVHLTKASAREGNGEGKVAVVTGANSGIGAETVKALVQRGYRVVLACRNGEAGEKAKREIARESSQPGAEALMSVMDCDLSSLDSVRGFASAFSEGYESLDVLVNNAGCMNIPNLRKTSDGFEMQWGVNYLSHYHLTSLLMGKLLKSPSSRVVNVASAANSFSNKLDLGDMEYQRAGYDSWLAYSNSKLGNLMFTFELDRRLKEADISHVATNAVHPGLVKTNLGRYMSPTTQKIFSFMPNFFVLDAAVGAKVQIDMAMSREMEGVSGKYFADQTFKFKPGKYEEEALVISPLAKDKTMQKSLWEYSKKVTESDWSCLQQQVKIDADKASVS